MGSYKFKSDFLFPTSSFVTGMGTAFNLAGNYFIYNESETPMDADLNALRSDWGVIGDELTNALIAINRERP